MDSLKACFFLLIWLGVFLLPMLLHTDSRFQVMQGERFFGNATDVVEVKSDLRCYIKSLSKIGCLVVNIQSLASGKFLCHFQDEFVGEEVPFNYPIGLRISVHILQTL